MLGLVLPVLLVSGLVQGQQEYYDDGAEYDNASIYYTDYTDYSPGPETPSADLFNSFVNLDPNLVDANANFIQPETANDNISQDIATEATSDLTNESDSENQAASESQADSESQAASESQADSESVNLFGQESEIEEYTNEEQTSVDYDNQIDSDNVNEQPFDQKGQETISDQNIKVNSLNEAENSINEDFPKEDSATTNLDNTQIFDNDENSEPPNNGFVITEVLQNTQDNLDTFNQNVNEEFPDTNTNEIFMSKIDENIPVFSPSSFSVSEASSSTTSTSTATSTTRETTTQNFEGETSTENMCHEYRGRSNIVLDIFESIGRDFSQATNPRELPLYGQIGSNIQLELVSTPGNRFFQLSGKSLNLVQVLDRDTTDLSSIVLQVQSF